MVIKDNGAYFCRVFDCVDVHSKKISNGFFEHCISQTGDLSVAEFNSCEFINCIFVDCNLNGTRFFESRLKDVKFFNSNG
jgi:fluoroquinolone resistance protein